MLNNITQVVRSNQNAVMLRVGNGSAANTVYTIFDLKSRTNTFTGFAVWCQVRLESEVQELSSVRDEERSESPLSIRVGRYALVWASINRH